MKKIVIIGPESTGKSMLCKHLARHYGTLWCPEYARQYLLKYGTYYNYDDLLTIAKGQMELEKKCTEELTNQKFKPHIYQSNVFDFRIASKPSSILFIDTDMYVMRVWCEFVFDNCHRYVLDQIVERKYDLYLLCNVDLPWSRDKLREYPNLKDRLKLYRIYKEFMINQSTAWVDISGNYEERLKKAICAVNSLSNEAS